MEVKSFREECEHLESYGSEVPKGFMTWDKVALVVESREFNYVVQEDDENSFDSRPYIPGKGPLPVFYKKISNQGVEITLVKGGDVKAFIEKLPVDTMIVLPNYFGNTILNKRIFVKVNDKFWTGMNVEF